MDATILLLDDPRITVKVHRLCLLDAEDHITTIMELCYVLKTPLGPQHRTIKQQEQDIQLMEEWVAQQECHTATGACLVAATAMS